MMLAKIDSKHLPDYVKNSPNMIKLKGMERELGRVTKDFVKYSEFLESIKQDLVKTQKDIEHETALQREKAAKIAKIQGLSSTDTSPTPARKSKASPAGTLPAASKEQTQQNLQNIEEIHELLITHTPSGFESAKVTNQGFFNAPPANMGLTANSEAPKNRTLQSVLNEHELQSSQACLNNQF